MIRSIVAFLVAALLWTPPAGATSAPLTARIDISSQTMTVYEHGRLTYRWAVSTARRGKYTPRGTYSGKWLSLHHKSSRYDNAPMPYSIFFKGHYAIHGTYQTKALGRPASAGCIRLHPKHAAILFDKARRIGPSNMRVVIHN